MALSPQPGISDLYPPVQEEVARLEALPEVRFACEWFRKQEAQFARWQMEVANIAAPPFGEAARGAWLVERFREIGLDEIAVDAIGNVFGVHAGFGRQIARPARCTRGRAHFRAYRKCRP